MIALDLFAGTGWGVACKRLGIEEYGVEIAPASVATRAANGMETIYHDVWEGLENAPRLLAESESAERMAALSRVFDVEQAIGIYELLIASPPCQTFSMAGNGAGRKALDEVLSLIDAKAYRDVAELRAFGERHDPRTSLVLTPLAHVYRDAPTYVVMEQVPTVLPVWERVAEEMRAWGYSVVTGNLQAEMYGVPQTRKRAILIARADGVEATMPTPTHSRYYSRDPKRLDPGVKPWVSMAEALGWGMTDKPMHTLTGGTHGAPDEFLSGGASVREKVRAKIGGPNWVTGAARHRGAGMLERHGSREPRPIDAPALTVTGNASGTTPGGFRWVHGETGEEIKLDPAKPATTVQGDPRLTAREHHYHGEQSSTSTRVTVAEAAALQSYPEGFVFEGTNSARYLHIGNAVPPLLAEAILSTLLPERIES